MELSLELIYISRHVLFDESNFPSQVQAATSSNTNSSQLFFKPPTAIFHDSQPNHSTHNCQPSPPSFSQPNHSPPIGPGIIAYKRS